MMHLGDLGTLPRLRASNSLAFVDKVFDHLTEARPFVVQPSSHGAGPPVQCEAVPDTFGWYARDHSMTDLDLPAMVVFTSGTEGPPKAIVLSHLNLAYTTGRIVSAMGLTDEVREYVGVPVTHSFGLGRIRAVSAVGGRAYLSPRGFDAVEFSRMLASGDVNALSAVPTTLRVILKFPEFVGRSGDRLRWLEIGSQHMTAHEKREIRQVFPNARIVQHYGLTEASRTTFLDVSDASNETLDSVGKPGNGIEVRVTSSGRIQIRGNHVARYQLRNDRHEALTDADGWLLTSDTGRIFDGHLYFEGRCDDVINCGGIKIPPDILEAAIRDRLKTLGAVVAVRIPDQMRGDGILLVAEATALESADIRSAALDSLKSWGVSAAGALHVRTQESIPLTPTGKPNRRILAQAFIDSDRSG
jgi:acyl-CoA synthetase (AMP-forming)/AMP-acid ligase II